MRNGMKPRHFLGPILAALALTSGGCGKEEQASTGPLAGAPVETASPAGGSAAAITTAELDQVGKASQPYKLALIVKTRNNPFFDPMIKAAEQEAKALGVSLE